MAEIAKDDHVVLRTIEDADAEDLLAVLGDPEVMRYGTTGSATLADCRNFITSNRAEGERNGVTGWAVCTPADATLLGYCRLRIGVEWAEPGEIEIGYRLATRAWGKGLATRAARLARRLAFETHGADRLIAVIDPGNTASIAVAERLGMRPIRELMLPEYDHPDVVYALTAGEYRRDGGTD
ncbi:MAG: GNAT family N-acetyltransferase [Actinomycetota bacterium]